MLSELHKELLKKHNLGEKEIVEVFRGDNLLGILKDVREGNEKDGIRVVVEKGNTRGNTFAKGLTFKRQPPKQNQ